MKKKILIIDGPLGGGGAERVLIDILNNIDYSKYDIDLALIYEGGVLLNQVPKDVNIISLWHGYNFSYKFSYRLSKWLYCNWLFSKKMNSKLLRKDYDVEISFLEGMPLKLHALRKTKTRHITWVHADLLRFPYESSQFYSGEEKKAYNKMSKIIHVSNASMSAFKQRFSECNTKQEVIYNPIDIDKIIRLSNDNLLHKPMCDFHIVAVGRLTQVKRPDRFLEIAKLAALKGKNFHFTWVGEGELKDAMVARRNEFGLQDTLDFVGFCKNPFPYMKNADVLVVTSEYESFCLAICEAMSMGVPVVSTKSAGPEEIIDNNKYGILCSDNPEDIFNCICKIKNDSSLRESIIKKGLIRAKDFNIDHTIRNFQELIG